MKIRTKKPLILFTYFICILCLSMGGGFYSFADKNKDDDSDGNGKKSVDELKSSISEKEGKINSLEKEKKQLNAGKSNIQAIVKDLQNKKAAMSAYVTELDGQVADIQSNIDRLNGEIENKEAEIKVTEAELVAAEAVAEDQYEAMKKRIRFMYERGDTLYLEMLLNAESFGDMLNKAEYIEKLSEYDRNMLDEYRLVIKEVELSRDLLNEQKQVLDETKAAAEEEQENINTLIDEKKKQIEGFDSDIANNEAAIKQYDSEIAAQNSEIAALEAALAAEREQLDEATRIHYNGGAFTFPAPSYTRVSDSYGWRMHPTLHVEKFHNGVDLAAPGGSPILAAYDGRVAAAGYSSSMGNYIMIDHGDTLYTIYMHASALYVSKGDKVKKGQKIGAVGSTGRSTGNHLHFGVRKNGEYVNPMSYL